MSACNTMWNHLKNWFVEYFFVPLSLVFIWGAVELHFLIVGRPSQDDPYQWMVNAAPRLSMAILGIAVISLLRQATGVWLTKFEKLNHPIYASVQTVCSTASYIYLLFYFSH